MKTTIFLGFGIGLSLAALSACAPTVWVKPGATSAEFSMDNARCRLVAEGANPDFGSPTIYTGSLKGDLAANVGAGLLHGLAQGVAVSHTHDLCMEANGYIAVAPGAVQPKAPPMQAAYVAPRAPDAPVTYRPPPTGSPVADNMSGSQLPVASAGPAPSQGGRVVLFPVTINNPYHPHWTVVQ